MSALASLFGALGLVAAIAKFQTQSRAGLLYLNLAAAALFTVHFFLLGAYSGAIQNLIITGTSLVYAVGGERISRRWAALVALTAMALMLCFVYERTTDLLPLLAFLLGRVAESIQDNLKMRYALLCTPPVSFAYALQCGSGAAMLNEVVKVGSNLFGLWRLHRASAATREASEETSLAAPSPAR